MESFMDRFTPHFVIYLAENNRPSLTLNTTSIHQCEESDFEQVIWVPTLENTLEDALLMIVLYLHKDPQIVKVAEKYFRIEQKVECYDIPEEGRKILYNLLENYKFNDYIIISVFESSLLARQVDSLRKYNIDGELGFSKRIIKK